MLNSKMLKQFNKAYEDDALKAAVYGASPVGLVVLLYEGAIKAINQAGYAIEAQRYDEKARLVSKTIDIIDGLRESLDLQQGSDAANNLNDLYIYMKQRLSIANLKNDLEILAEVRRLLETILPAWQELNRSGMSAGTTSSAY
ncbi:flagellar biosynthesis protein FliS [Aquitalea magnusonii]|jgi:flagellar protein FliS|uniref:Flagellar secretion chaperone FliS n=1 Tax=Aquitalea magnusonii TaxID=332411 RepID=A0A3G9GA00_9NEIS|nr:flagellar export chaperone FliS [Aquitalea magnusonii]BBF83693.1 flagellar biosynthesis protein FliS [Aquitalea magnusonii]